MANGYVVPNITTLSTIEYKNDQLISSIPFDVPEYYNDIDYTDTYGFGVITFINSTHLYYKTVSDTETTTAKDEFWIIKEHN